MPDEDAAENLKAGDDTNAKAGDAKAGDAVTDDGEGKKKKRSRKRKRDGDSRRDSAGPNRVALYAIVGYSEKENGAVDTSGTAYKYSHKKDKPSIVSTSLSRSGKTKISNPLYSPEGAKYLRFWIRNVGFFSPALLGMHRIVTGCDVHGNNQLSEAAMKAEKMQDNIDEHLSGVAEYAEYWNELAIGSITNAVEQIGEMPARIARRDRLSAARSRTKIDELTDEGEEEESMWSRDGTLEREGKRLRMNLIAMEEKDGVTVAAEVYKRLCDWLVKTKGQSLEQLKKNKEIMVLSTFTGWFRRGVKLGKSKLWRENISEYISAPKETAEPPGKRIRRSPLRQ